MVLPISFEFLLYIIELLLSFIIEQNSPTAIEEKTPKNGERKNLEKEGWGKEKKCKQNILPWFCFCACLCTHLFHKF